MDAISSSSSEEDVGDGGIGNGLEIMFMGGVMWEDVNGRFMAELVLLRLPGGPNPG